MMKLFYTLCLSVLMFCMGAGSVTAQTQRCDSFWTGSWDTPYGQLRLIEDGDSVYGDYAGLGTIKANLDKVCGDWLRGTFERKDGSWGYIEFVESGDDGNRFSGRWMYSTQQGLPSWKSKIGTEWRGTRTDDGMPPILNFRSTESRDPRTSAPRSQHQWLQLLDVIIAEKADDIRRAQEVADREAAAINAKLSARDTPKAYIDVEHFDGKFDSTYGELRLTQWSNYVFGDYKDIGKINGWVSPDGRRLRAKFTRSDGGAGYAEWVASGYSDTSIKGRWTYKSSGLPNYNFSRGDRWDMTRTSTSSTSSVSPLNKKRFIESLSDDEYHWIKFSDLPQYYEPDNDVFTSRNTLDTRKFLTLITMQSLVKAMSEDSAEIAGTRLQNAGYELVGRGVFEAAGISDQRLRAAVIKKNKNIIVIFRGTAGSNIGQTIINSVISDGNVMPRKPHFLASSKNLSPSERNAFVHAGFDRAYANLRSDINHALRSERNESNNIYILGHSLGGAMATLMALDVAVNYPDDYRSLTHIVSGSPRVGTDEFSRAFSQRVPNNLRVVVNEDPIPTIPRLVYVHAGRLLVINEDGKPLNGKDINLATNPIRFFKYHKYETYAAALRKMDSNYRNDGAFRPNGNNWIQDTSVLERRRTRNIAN